MGMGFDIGQLMVINSIVHHIFFLGILSYSLFQFTATIIIIFYFISIIELFLAIQVLLYSLFHWGSVAEECASSCVVFKLPAGLKSQHSSRVLLCEGLFPRMGSHEMSLRCSIPQSGCWTSCGSGSQEISLYF